MREIRTSGATRGAGELSLLPPTLPLEVRIVGGHVALEPMRLEPMLRPNPGHHHVREPEMLTEFACAPVCAPIRRRSACRRQNPGLQLRGALRCWLPTMSTVQAGESLGRKAFRPAIDVSVRAIQSQADLGPGCSIRCQQNAPSPARFISPPFATRNATPQHPSLDFAQRQAHRTLQVVR